MTYLDRQDAKTLRESQILPSVVKSQSKYLCQTALAFLLSLFLQFILIASPVEAQRELGNNRTEQQPDDEDAEALNQWALKALNHYSRGEYKHAVDAILEFRLSGTPDAELLGVELNSLFQSNDLDVLAERIRDEPLIPKLPEASAIPLMTSLLESSHLEILGNFLDRWQPQASFTRDLMRRFQERDSADPRSLCSQVPARDPQSRPELALLVRRVALLLGDNFKDQLQLGPSIDCYQLALNWSPGWVPALRELGTAYKELGKFKEAADVWDQGWKNSGSQATWLMWIVEARLEAGQYSLAEAAMDRMLELDSSALFEVDSPQKKPQLVRVEDEEESARPVLSAMDVYSEEEDNLAGEFEPVRIISSEGPTLPRPQVEFSFISRYVSESRGESVGERDESGWIKSASTHLQVDLLRREGQVLTGRLRLGRSYGGSLLDQGFWEFGGGLVYRHGAHRLGLNYFSSPTRFVVLSEAARLADRIEGLDFGYRNRLSSLLETQVEYEYVRHRLDSLGLKTHSHELSSGLRFRFHDMLNPAVGFSALFFRGPLQARYREMTPVFQLRSRLGERLFLNFRFRRRLRSYEVRDALASNFGRRDSRNDLDVSARIKITDQFRLLFYAANYQRASTRAGRDFSGFERGLGLSYTLP